MYKRRRRGKQGLTNWGSAVVYVIICCCCCWFIYLFFIFNVKTAQQKEHKGRLKILLAYFVLCYGVCSIFFMLYVLFIKKKNDKILLILCSFLRQSHFEWTLF